MKALVFYKPGDIRYEPNWADARDPGPGEVKIATSWCGICGTDLEDFERGGVIPIEKPNPVSGRMAPMVFGHEYSGRIAELGAGVKALKEGQRVAVECVKGCGKCYWCQHHQNVLCESMVSIGQQDDGGMAEYFVAPAENCVPIPKGLDEDVAAMAEPLAVAVRAVRKSRMTPGDLVTVIGAGAIGLCGIAAARVAGAREVIVIAHGGHRAEIAKKMGAHHVLNSRDKKWMEQYMDLTHGLKSDVVLDTGGTIPAIQLAVQLTAKKGRCVMVSVVADQVPLGALDILLNEKELIGSVGHTFEEEYPWSVQYMADGRIDLTPLITGKVYIENAIKDGLLKLQKDRNEIKVLVTPHKDWV